MRLLERTLKTVRIAPRMVAQDALGGRVEEFSPETSEVRASVIPSTGGLENRESGLLQVRTMCLLMPVDAQVRPGDGICVDTVRPEWRCVDVQKWSAHVAVRVERMAC